MIKAVIFDWAGTTVDYGSFAPVKAIMEAFKSFGIEVTAEETRKPMGLLKIDHIRTMLETDRINRLWENKYNRKPDDEDVNKIYANFEPKLLSILKDFTEPKPYVIDAVRELRAMGIKIGSTTGYNDKMMEIVVPGAKVKGYSPDFWISPDGVAKKGRPYPYMIFANMQELEMGSVKEVMKIGDTVSDIKEGLNAGVISVGVTEGSSVAGLTEDEFHKLSEEERTTLNRKTAAIFREAGADFVISNMGELPQLVRAIGCDN